MEPDKTSMIIKITNMIIIVMVEIEDTNLVIIMINKINTIDTIKEKDTNQEIKEKDTNISMTSMETKLMVEIINHNIKI